jgi:hypothetical protein
MSAPFVVEHSPERQSDDPVSEHSRQNAVTLEVGAIVLMTLRAWILTY